MIHKENKSLMQNISPKYANLLQSKPFLGLPTDGAIRGVHTLGCVLRGQDSLCALKNSRVTVFHLKTLSIGEVIGGRRYVYECVCRAMVE